MSNSCLETTTRACIHWPAVKCAVILCSDMSRKRVHTVPSISRHFYSLFFYFYCFFHYYSIPLSFLALQGWSFLPFLPFFKTQPRWSATTQRCSEWAGCAMVSCEKIMKIQTGIPLLHSKALEVF